MKHQRDICAPSATYHSYSTAKGFEAMTYIYIYILYIYIYIYNILLFCLTIHQYVCHTVVFFIIDTRKVYGYICAA